MDPLNNKWLTVGLCTYEVVAILSKREDAPAERPNLPTITAIVRKHPWAGVLLMGAMGWHFATSRNGET